jgi:hypothetical protein
VNTRRNERCVTDRLSEAADTEARRRPLFGRTGRDPSNQKRYQDQEHHDPDRDADHQLYGRA